MKEEEEANADSTVETEVPSLQRSLGAEAPGHQKVQPGAVEEQFEKKLEQLEDQLEEHAQDAAAHGEVEKVRRRRWWPGSCWFLSTDLWSRQLQSCGKWKTCEQYIQGEAIINMNNGQ